VVELEAVEAVFGADGPLGLWLGGRCWNLNAGVMGVELLGICSRLEASMVL